MVRIFVIVQYTIGTLCINMQYNGVKGTSSLAEGAEGRQGLPFYTNTVITATWYENLQRQYPEDSSSS